MSDDYAHTLCSSQYDYDRALRTFNLLAAVHTFTLWTKGYAHVHASVSDDRAQLALQSVHSTVKERFH